MKKVVYVEDCHQQGGQAEVVYVILGKNVYFSGITYPATTTINAAEYVITAIAQAEGWKSILLLREMNFFDLQTHRGYPRHQPGEFDFDRLRVVSDGARISVEGWQGVECPTDVRNLFREFIG